MSEWRGIETAPKDGKRFIGAVMGAEYRDGFLLVEITNWYPPRWMEHSGTILKGGFLGEMRHVPFTHWMPLPEPPK